MEAESTTFDRARLEATLLTAARVSWHLERLWSLPLEQRKKIVGLPKNRADIILMGVAIYQAVMEGLRFPRPAHQHPRPAPSLPSSRMTPNRSAKHRQKPRSLDRLRLPQRPIPAVVGADTLLWP